MAETNFISADIEKLIQFENDSAEAIVEFNAIKEAFNDINSTLLKNWQGEGADAYKKETDHILEKIGGIEEILKSINEGIIKDVKDSYVKLDEQLAEYNKNPEGSE